MARVNHNVVPPIQPDMGERRLAELLDRVRLAGGDDEVARLGLLEHQVHRPDVVRGVAPVAPRLQVTQPQVAVYPVLDPGHSVADLAADELEPPAFTLVVERDARAGV